MLLKIEHKRPISPLISPIGLIFTGEFTTLTTGEISIKVVRLKEYIEKHSNFYTFDTENMEIYTPTDEGRKVVLRPKLYAGSTSIDDNAIIEEEDIQWVGATSDVGKFSLKDMFKFLKAMANNSLVVLKQKQDYLLTKPSINFGFPLGKYLEYNMARIVNEEEGQENFAIGRNPQFVQENENEEVADFLYFSDEVLPFPRKKILVRDGATYVEAEFDIHATEFYYFGTLDAIPEPLYWKYPEE